MKRPAAVAIAVAAVLFASNVLVSSMLGLGDAEALYYNYSRHLALSYLDHPPLIGWLIAASVSLFGTSVLAVRLVPLCMTGLCLLFAYRATAETFGKNAAAVSALLLFASPVFSIGMTAASPDAPLAACVLLFTWQLHRALTDDSRGVTARVLRPTLLGALVGLAFLAKYTGACLVLSVFALLCQKPYRRFLTAPGLYLGALAAAAFALPVVIWNVRHGYIGVLHRLVYTQGGAGFSLRNLGALIGGQLLYVGPLVLLLMGLAVRRYFRSEGEPPKVRNAQGVLLAVSLPMLAVTYLLCLWSNVAEPHWPAAGYLPLFPLAAHYLVETAKRRLLRWTVGLGAAVLGLAHIVVLTPLLPAIVPRPIYEPKYDLANEMRGWDEAADLLRHLDTDKRPVVAAFYTACSQLVFALNRADDPPVRCASKALTDFDIWYGRFALDERGAFFVTDNRFEHDPKAVLENATVGAKTTLSIVRGGIEVRRFRVWEIGGSEICTTGAREKRR